MAKREQLNLAKELDSPLVRGKSTFRLSNLVGKDISVDFSTLATKSIRISEIEVSDQIRKEFDEEGINSLAESLKEHGLLQPIIVAEKPEGGYRLVAGERRLRAAKKLGWFSIPAVVIPHDEERVRLIQLVENLQRRDLNLVEKSEGIWEYFKYIWKSLGGTDSPNLDELWLVFYYLNGGKKDKVKGKLEFYLRASLECSRFVDMPEASVLLHCLIANLGERVKEFLLNSKNISATHLRVLFLNSKPQELDEGLCLSILKEAEDRGLSRKEFERLLRKGKSKGSSRDVKDPYKQVDRFFGGLIKKSVDEEQKKRLLRYIIEKAKAELIKMGGEGEDEGI